MRDSRRVLFLFVDGLGLGRPDPAVNPLYRGHCPVLCRLLDGAAPLDATLGMPGLPQSATGQASLLTGINAAALAGRHVEGFPGAALRARLQADNLFLRVRVAGLHAAFANAYFTDDAAAVRARRHQSATTVAALAGLGGVRMTADLLAGRAVSHDLTRALWRERGFDGPLVTPAEAAGHLLGLGATHHLTLFEYFLTDLVAHKGTTEGLAARLASQSGAPAAVPAAPGAPRDLPRILAEFDAFLAAVLPFAEAPGRLLVLTSDHGNIEEGAHASHTRNPVPLVALGDGAAAVKQAARAITDVMPALLAYLAGPISGPSPRGCGS